MLKTEEIYKYLAATHEGFKPTTDSCFKNEIYFPKYVKRGIISVDDEEDFHPKNEIFCNIPGCERFFQSVFAYQAHYNSLHRYHCSHCKKNLPTPHLLDLHLSENHDSYFSVLSKSKPMYLCFIEECQHKSLTQEERKDHCIKEHKFPSNFRFDNLSLLSRRVANMELDEPMEDKKEPDVKKTTNFAFGHTKAKTFNKKSYAKLLTKSEVEYKNTLEDSKTLTDLLSSLPDAV